MRMDLDVPLSLSAPAHSATQISILIQQTTMSGQEPAGEVLWGRAWLIESIPERLDERRSECKVQTTILLAIQSELAPGEVVTVILLVLSETMDIWHPQNKSSPVPPTQ